MRALGWKKIHSNLFRNQEWREPADMRRPNQKFKMTYIFTRDGGNYRASFKQTWLWSTDGCLKESTLRRKVWNKENRLTWQERHLCTNQDRGYPKISQIVLCGISCDLWKLLLNGSKTLALFESKERKFENVFANVIQGNSYHKGLPTPNPENRYISDVFYSPSISMGWWSQGV